MSVFQKLIGEAGGILVWQEPSAITLSLPTSSENAGGNVSVFAGATMTAIVPEAITDALIENDLAEEVPAFKSHLKTRMMTKDDKLLI